MVRYYADARAPQTWRYSLGPIRYADGSSVNFAASKLMVVTVRRPNNTSVVWTSADGGITFPVSTPGLMVASHLYAANGSDVPFIQIGKNTLKCHYQWDIDLTVDGRAVQVLSVCRDLYNRRAC